MRVAAHLWPLLVLGIAPPSVRTHAPSPGRRSGAAMAYDVTRNELVLYGGTVIDSTGKNEAFATDLWAWNGSAWRQLIPSDGIVPPGRSLPHLAYDAARQRIVMFGGRRESSGGSVELPGKIWEWDGARWHQITTDTLPMLHAAIAYDSAHRRVTLFGGLNDDGISRTLRVWDGRAWHVRDSAGPPAGANPPFPVISATTPSGDIIVVAMQSGRSSDSVATVTWVWSGTSWARRELGPAITSLQPAASAPDGTIYIYQTSAFWLKAPVMHTRTPDGAWTHVTPQVRPEIRGIPAAAYDPRRKRFVLYTNALWEWDGLRWEKRS